RRSRFEPGRAHADRDERKRTAPFSDRGPGAVIDLRSPGLTQPSSVHLKTQDRPASSAGRAISLSAFVPSVVGLEDLDGNAASVGDLHPALPGPLANRLVLLAISHGCPRPGYPRRRAWPAARRHAAR